MSRESIEEALAGIIITEWGDFIADNCPDYDFDYLAIRHSMVMKLRRPYTQSLIVRLAYILVQEEQDQLAESDNLAGESYIVVVHSINDC